MRKETIASLGHNLAVGIPDPAGGGFVKPFEIKPWTFADDKNLAEKREDALTAGRFASEVIKYFSTSIGGVTLLEIPKAERDMLVNRLKMGDAFVVYINLRIKAKGKIFKPVLTCPPCGPKHKFKDTVDLSTTIVNCIDDPEELEHEFELSETYDVKLGEEIIKFNTLVIQPALWSEIETLPPESFNNTAKLIEAIVKGSIARLGDLDETRSRAALAVGVLDKFSKLDFDDVTEFINDNSPGPEMLIETKCPRCRTPFSTMLDWGFDTFFATSSRSRNSIRS